MGTFLEGRNSTDNNPHVIARTDTIDDRQTSEAEWEKEKQHSRDQDQDQDQNQDQNVIKSSFETIQKLVDRFVEVSGPSEYPLRENTSNSPSTWWAEIKDKVAFHEHSKAAQSQLKAFPSNMMKRGALVVNIARQSRVNIDVETFVCSLGTHIAGAKEAFGSKSHGQQLMSLNKEMLDKVLYS